MTFQLESTPEDAGCAKMYKNLNSVYKYENGARRGLRSVTEKNAH